VLAMVDGKRRLRCSCRRVAADSGGGSNGAHLVAKGSDTWSPSLSVAAAVGGGIGGGQRLMAAALVACSG